LRALKRKTTKEIIKPSTKFMVVSVSAISPKYWNKIQRKKLSNYKCKGLDTLTRRVLFFFTRHSLDVTKWGSPAATYTCLVTAPVPTMDRNTARSTDIEIGDEIIVHSYVFEVPLVPSQLLRLQKNSSY
jgi:hypothetical protein